MKNAAPLLLLALMACDGGPTAPDSEGQIGDWSRTGHFRFEPCRVDGRACLAR